MDWIKIISIILLFFLWAYILYRWMKTERKLENKGIEISNLKRDLAYWRDSAKEGRTKLIANRKKVECEVEYQSNTIGKYIVEVNEGVYLRKAMLTTHRNVGVVYTFTDDFEKASKFKDAEECKKIAKQCKGKVLYDSPNWEVVE